MTAVALYLFVAFFVSISGYQWLGIGSSWRAAFMALVVGMLWPAGLIACVFILLRLGRDEHY